ncbi:hypothetical protein [Olivibacter sp. SDN3]|uniref:hypothetical protein n=1 Tax=Olivibacter sp. SDN3 TaxID=2764720 RepID=UPI002102EDF2|nr:hypothetical protein [Olivibacter sp. SDN3]
MIKNAPFRFSDFESIEFNYGSPENMVNKFNSASEHYQYINKKDSVITASLKLRKDDLLYLHRKATEYGFWNFPEDMTMPENSADPNKMRFSLKFNYKEKSKEVVFDSDFKGDPKLFDAAKTMIGEVERILNDAEDRN